MPKVGMEPIRRDQIRRAAAKVVARRGFDGTTLLEIAKSAGVSTGTINHYYPNKLAVMVDTLIYVSDWFQTRMKRAVGKENSAPDKFRALVREGIFGGGKMAEIGQSVWIWAISESIRSKALRDVIQERRRLFQEILADAIRELDVAHNMSEDDIREFAAECDAYWNGIGNHWVTGERKLEPEAVERSLLSMARARANDAAAARRKSGIRSASAGRGDDTPAARN